VGAPAAIFVLILLALFFLPTYLPLLVSFTFRGPDWKEVRWCLRGATVASVLLLLSVPSKPNQFGDDVGGNLAGAAANFPALVAIVWMGGICFWLAGWLLGLRLRSERHKRDTNPAGMEELRANDQKP